MKSKLEIIVGIGIAVCVIVTLAFYLLNAGTLDIGEIGLSLIVLILVVFASYILWDRLKNVKKGLPSKDERLILINYKAGFYGFIAAIWSSTFGPLSIDILFDHELPGSHVTALVVIVSGLVFAISYLVMYLKGE